MNRSLALTLCLTLVALVGCRDRKDSDHDADSATVMVLAARQTAAQKAQVRIAGFSPDQGTPGTVVQITGDGFEPNAPMNRVSFGGADAPVRGANAKFLEVEVPQGAQTGAIELEIGSSTYLVGEFTVLPVIHAGAPVQNYSHLHNHGGAAPGTAGAALGIVALEPAVAVEGQELHLLAVGLDCDQDQHELTLDGQRLALLPTVSGQPLFFDAAFGMGRLAFVVPGGFKSGRADLELRLGTQRASIGLDLVSEPRILSVQPAQTAVGAPLRVTGPALGNHFTPVEAFLTGPQGEIPASVTYRAFDPMTGNALLDIKVPAGAVSGPLRLVSAGVAAAGSFSVAIVPASATQTASPASTTLRPALPFGLTQGVNVSLNAPTAAPVPSSTTAAPAAAAAAPTPAPAQPSNPPTGGGSGTPNLPTGGGNSNASGFVFPLSGDITSTYYDARPWGLHGGIDIVDYGAGQITAALDGEVIHSGWNNQGYGNLVILKHSSGYTTYYAHLKSFQVSYGQRVGQGQNVGIQGATGYVFGAHLHFEVRRNGAQLDIPVRSGGRVQRGDALPGNFSGLVVTTGTSGGSGSGSGSGGNSGSSAPSGSYALVTASTLNVRSGPGTNYSVVGVVYSGERLTALGKQNAWLNVQFQGQSRWVHGNFVMIVGTIPPTVPSTATSSSSAGSGSGSGNAASGQIAEVTTSALNVRTGAGTNFAIAGVAHQGDRLKVLGASGVWVNVEFQGQSRWVHSGYVRLISGSSGASGGVSTPYAEVTTSALNVRTGPSTNYAVVGTAKQGERFSLQGSSGAWLKIDFQGQSRWIHGGYAKVVR